MSTTEVVVGRIGRAHGVRGEVSVEPRTDEPERRFTRGAVLRAHRPDGTPSTAHPATLTVQAARWHQSRLLVSFEELTDRDRAEAVRGVVLATDVDAADSPEDPEEFYDHQLVGLRVTTVAGAAVGEVDQVRHSGAQDLLVVRTAEGSEVLVPFVRALVPTVDVAAGRLEVVDQPGLLGPEEPEEPEEPEQPEEPEAEDSSSRTPAPRD